MSIDNNGDNMKDSVYLLTVILPVNGVPTKVHYALATSEVTDHLSKVAKDPLFTPEGSISIPLNYFIDKLEVHPGDIASFRKVLMQCDLSIDAKPILRALDHITAESLSNKLENAPTDLIAKALVACLNQGTLQAILHELGTTSTPKKDNQGA